MSRYTITLRNICQTLADKYEMSGYPDLNVIIDETWKKIFNFNFPIFDEAYKEVLCKKIIKHYYMREIGFETFGEWQFKLDTMMNEIMPYYNKLYETERLNYDPLIDTDITTIYGETNKNKSTASSNTKANSSINAEDETRQMYSDTPQGGLQGVLSGEYLTDARVNTSSGATHTEVNENSSGNSESDGAKDSTTQVRGKSGSTSFTKLVVEYREALLNIDKQIIDELNVLFLNLW